MNVKPASASLNSSQKPYIQWMGYSIPIHAMETHFFIEDVTILLHN